MKDKYFIFRERSSLFSPCYWNAIYQTSLQTKRIHGVALDFQWQCYCSGRMTQFVKRADWDKKAEYIFKKLLKKGYFNKIKNKVEKKKRKAEFFIEKFNKTDISGLSFKELIKLANKIKKVCLDYDSTNVLVWLLGTDKLSKYLFEKLNLSEEEFNLIITPEEKTAVSQLEEKIASYSKEIKENKRDLNEAARELSDDYGWLPFGYDGPDYWDKEYFIHKLSEGSVEKGNKNDFSERRKEILSKLDREDSALVQMANILALWTDERKKYTFQLYYLYSRILWELEKRYDISYKNLKYLLTEEIAGLEKNKEMLKDLSDKRINDDFMIEAKEGAVKIISDKKKERILKELESQNKESEIKGMVACRGTQTFYKGRVKVILSPREADKIKEGDFLAATMTSPDYILAMKKAAGFITDEGGVTCHAAIVAREMNKPCIIGTKIATKVLKDGDLVEVDANSGMVKVIKKAG